MAGIAGSISPDIYHIHHYMDEMLETLSHRGPVSKREFTRDVHSFKNIKIGSSGNVAGSNPKQSIVVVFDGSLYNSEQLAERLIADGYHTPSNPTPADIAVLAYSAWGEKFAKELNGEFALALLDKTKETLYLFRDRVGVKPLYWSQKEGLLLFASELKALLATGSIAQDFEPDAISTYLAMGYLPQDMTPIKGVNKLLPAHYLKFPLNKGLSIHPYWSYSEELLQPEESNVIQSLEKLDHLLHSAVSKRIFTETPGCFVSGGLGSASIARYVQFNPQVKQAEAVTVGFKDYNNAEFHAAEGFASALKMQQNVGVITPETLLDELVQIIWYLDEPIADLNVIATWNGAKLASSQVQDIFSGMGSDELLAGHGRYTLDERSNYSSYTYELFYQKLLSWVIPLYRKVSPGGAFNFLKHARSNIDLLGYIKSSCIFDVQELDLLSPSLKGLFNPDYFVHRFHNLNNISSSVSQYQYLDFKTRLPDLYAMQYERLTMAFGLNWRAPFLDNDVINYLAHFPEPTSLLEKDTASLLKKIVGDTFAKELINRPKKTRTNFLADWVESAELTPIFQMLRTGSLIESGIISEEWIIKATADSRSCKRNFTKLWSLLTLEIWFRLFVNFPVSKSCPTETLKELISRR